MSYNIIMSAAGPKFQAILTDFLEYLEIEQNRSQKTIANYDHYLTRLIDYAGDIGGFRDHARAGSQVAVVAQQARYQQ